MATLLERMNALAEEAVKKLVDAEENMVNYAIETWISLPCGVRFGWADCAGRWRFAHIGKAGEPLPIKDAPRVARIEAAENIQALTVAIETATDQWLKKYGG